MAAYGLAQLRIIDDLLYKRYVNQERYIKNGVKLITYLTQQSTGTWMNILRCKNAHNLMWHLKSNGIESRMLYKPCDVAKGLGPDMNLSMSYKLYEQLLYLPSSLTLTNDQIDYISEKILGYEK